MWNRLKPLAMRSPRRCSCGKHPDASVITSPCRQEHAGGRPGRHTCDRHVGRHIFDHDSIRTDIAREPTVTRPTMTAPAPDEDAIANLSGAPVAPKVLANRDMLQHLAVGPDRREIAHDDPHRVPNE